MNEKETKNKGSKLPLIVGLIVVVLIGAIVAVFMIPKMNSAKENSTVVATSEPSVQMEEEVIADTSKNQIIIPTIKDVLPSNQINRLEEILKSEESVSQRTGRTARKTEVFYAVDENGNHLSLHDTLLEGVNLNDGILFETISRGDTGEKESITPRRSRSRSSREPNNSLPETVDNLSVMGDTKIPSQDYNEYTPKIIGRVYFQYGSFLEMSKTVATIETYLLFSKVDEETKEYASIILGLNDLISAIPEDKRDVAKFRIVGYTDTSLFNGVHEISERSEIFNTELSSKRAESIKTILTSEDFGISPEQIVTQGFGYSKNPEQTTAPEIYRRVDIGIDF